MYLAMKYGIFTRVGQHDVTMMIGKHRVRLHKIVIGYWEQTFRHKNEKNDDIEHDIVKDTTGSIEDD